MHGGTFTRVPCKLNFQISRFLELESRNLGNENAKDVLLIDSIPGGSSQSFLSFQYFDLYCAGTALQGEIEISDMKIVSSPRGVGHLTIQSPRVSISDRNCLLSMGSI